MTPFALGADDEKSTDSGKGRGISGVSPEAGRESPEGRKSLKDCTVSIFGLGLLGASLGWKLSMDGAVRNVAGWSRNPETVRTAAERGIISHPCTTAEECASLGDILIFAVPIRAMEETSRAASGCSGKKKAVFDLSSTKKEIGRLLSAHWGEAYCGFHPMAGKESSGMENADPALFQGSLCALVPFPGTAPEVISLGEELAFALGGRPLLLGPEEHDGITACVSHFPLLLAASLALLAEREREQHPLLPLLAAGGFRDTTRVAGGPPWLGADMVQTNGEEIRRLAKGFGKILEELLASSPGELEELLERGKKARESILSAEKIE